MQKNNWVLKSIIFRFLFFFLQETICQLRVTLKLIFTKLSFFKTPFSVFLFLRGPIQSIMAICLVNSNFFDCQRFFAIFYLPLSIFCHFQQIELSKESPVLRDHPRLEKAKSKAMVGPGLYQGPMCIRLGASSDVARLKRFRILTFHERIGFFWAKIWVKFTLFYHVLTYFLPSILHIGESKLLQ
jgi:hypothetical protein